MGDFDTIDLGEAGLAFVRDRLGKTNGLCAALLETVHAHPGKVFTIAPVGTSVKRLMQFDQGGLLAENLERVGALTLADGSVLVPVVSMVEQQAALLRTTMSEMPGATCILDDFHPRWGDQVSHLGPTAFGVGEEVYHLLTSDHGKQDFIDAIRLGNVVWHGAVAVCRDSITLDASRETLPSELQRRAASAILITCVAYDGEGFVAWRRATA